LKRAEVRDAERVDREAELQTELEAAKQDMGTYPQVCNTVFVCVCACSVECVLSCI